MYLEIVLFVSLWLNSQSCLFQDDDEQRKVETQSFSEYSNHHITRTNSYLAFASSFVFVYSSRTVLPIS
jgi:hypothetical protein